jgi:sortase A
MVGIVCSFTVLFFLVRGLPAEAFSGNQLPPVGTQTPQPLASATSAGSTSTDTGLPVRLRIPKIGVDAALEYVGLTADGEMGVPEGPSNAAWFDAGPRPGEEGTAVIDGHYGWKDDIPAVFDDLIKLQKGDKIYVEDQGGTTIAFVVRDVRTYAENESTSGVFVSSDGKVHLNLITCEGVWSAASKSYSERLVVFADEE